MDQQDLLRQATQSLRECADENDRLVGEHTRLREEAHRSAGFAARAAATRVIPVVVWPEPAFPLTFERFRSGAWYLGQALRHFVQNLPARTPAQRYEIALALCNGWYGDQSPVIGESAPVSAQSRGLD